MKEIRPIILFVDDEELARRTFQRIVEKEFRVLVAGDVAEAIEVLKEHHEDIGVLLSDQRMPGRLGVDLLEHCRREYPDIVRMLTTAYSELNDAIAAVNRGEIMRYIEKPWGNIDGILIDLKLAATLYEIKKENQQLIDEKLSVGFKTSQMEKIRSLITISACQKSRNSLLAVESLLRQIADVDACFRMPDITDLRNYQMFGQPLNNTIGAIELGEYMANPPEAGNSSVAELLGSSGKIDKLSDSDFSAIVSNTFLVMGNQAKVEMSEETDGAVIRVSAQGEGAYCIQQWLGSYEVTSEVTQQVGALLKLFIIVFELDGRIQLEIAEQGFVAAIKISLFTPQNSQPLDDSRYYDWIDDLMILFN